MTPTSGAAMRRPFWRGGRVVECTGFENRQGRKLFGSSNLPLSALCMNITLIGMPASGKTQVGKKLAEEIGYVFIDPDKMIEAEYGKPLQDILEELGDETFLVKEEEVTRTATRGRNKCIIATGGSVVHTESLMEYLADISFIIYLDASLPILAKRIGDQKRGIVWAGTNAIDELFARRTPLYKKWANISVPADGDSEEVSKRIVEVLPESAVSS
jgi:shikimate kinase